MVEACINGVVLTMIDYALVFALGKTGLAVGLIILLLQVPGSGGTFPVEVLPKEFQALYPYMPFHYALTAMRECIGGMYRDTYVRSLCMLAVVFLVAFAAGLVLYFPSKKVNQLLEESMAGCEVMD